MQQQMMIVPAVPAEAAIFKSPVIKKNHGELTSSHIDAFFCSPSLAFVSNLQQQVISSHKII